MKLLGIDIGGTKTSVSIGTDTGKILAAARVPTQSTDGADIYFARLRQLADDALGKAETELKDVTAAGISAPGPLSVKDGILLAPPNCPGWENFPITKPVADLFRKPTFMNNDANAVALAEYRFGARKGVPDMMYLTLSTGLGAGIIVNGKLVQGINDMGGEVGHMILDANGPPCGCGLNGCLEAYVGGRNVAVRLQKRIREDDIATTIVEKAGGVIEDIDFQAFSAAAIDGDAFALQEWDIFIERLAQGTGALIMTLNPQAIFLGTFAVHLGEFLMAPLRERLKKYAWEWPLDVCEILPSSFDTDTGDIGAIAVAITGLED